MAKSRSMKRKNGIKVVVEKLQKSLSRGRKPSSKNSYEDFDEVVQWLIRAWLSLFLCKSLFYLNY